ncbi:MAG: DUF4399 domain-containing protein [Kiloniellaceae bacterium]
MQRLSHFIASAIMAAGIGSAAAVAGETPAPPGAKVWIIWPKDGEIIHGGKLWVRMGARNIGVAPAGVIKPKTGHHHLIIDAELPPFDEDIPADKNHLHFGGGQTEARIELSPGRHTLQLLMGDHDHIPHNPPLYSGRITVVVP